MNVIIIITRPESAKKRLRLRSTNYYDQPREDASWIFERTIETKASEFLENL